MNELHKRNLLEVAAITAALDPKEFNIEVYNECNSVGCCLGWAACSPYFHKQGLKFHAKKKSENSYFSYKDTDDRWSEDFGETELYWHEICRDLFGLERGDNPLWAAFKNGKSVYTTLDGTEYYFNTPQEAAESILRYIEKETGEQWVIE